MLSRVSIRRSTPVLPVLLAATLLLDQVWWGGFETTGRHGLLVLAAFAVLIGPSSTVLLALLLAATTVSVAGDLPVVGTHRVVELVVAAALLVLVVLATLRARRPPPVDEVVSAGAPVLRVAVVVVYLASALAKVNTAFLDPVVSCAAPMVRLVFGPDPRLLGPALVATVAVEALLPLLLLVRRTRTVGVVAGTAFHVVLALAGNVPFSALMAALYAGFLPPAARLPDAPRVRRAVVGLLAVGWLVGAVRGPSSEAPGLTGPPSAFVAPAVGTVATAGYVALAALVVAVSLLTRDRDATPRSRPGVVVLVTTGVLVLNAVAPYAGWKTDTSFEMFSGLRTEAGSWNHLLVPPGVRLAATPYVEVVAASDQRLVARTANGTRIALPELDRALRDETGAVATYRTEADPAPRQIGPLPPGETLRQQLVLLRDAPPPGGPRC